MEEQDFQAFDKLQAETVKKFYEVRILQSFRRGRQEREAGGQGGGGGNH